MNDTKEYVVYLKTWDIYHVSIAARTATSAEEEAERLALDGKFDAFKHCDRGIEYAEAEEVQP